MTAPDEPRRWRDAGGSVWQDAPDDHVVLIEHGGNRVYDAGPWPRDEADRRWGPLIRIGELHPIDPEEQR